MKKMLILLAIFSGLVLISNAFATDIFMTDSNGSTTPKSTFTLSETPWLYVDLPTAGLNVIGSWWQEPSHKYDFAGSNPSENQQVWISPENWNLIKQTGLWNVQAVYTYAGGSMGSGTTSFKVVPEPFSSALFLLGGGALALGAYRKRASKKA